MDTTTPTAPTLVDESRSTQNNRTTWDRIYKSGGHTFRVIVTLDPYEFQCSAVAQVLSAHLTWTPLAVLAPEEWYPRTRELPGCAPHVMSWVADDLITRAIAILS